MSVSYQKKQVDEVVAYHHLSKHYFNRYAPSLGYLDWATQPDSFRRYAGAKNIPLRKIDSDEFLDLSYESVFHAKTDWHCKSDLNIDLISQLFFDSLSLSAWKRAGESRWALRVNPSSGNLHPTESYLLSGPVDSISDKAFVAHYSSDEHILELRSEFDVSLWNEVRKGFPSEVFFIGLSSIYWREAWKYGERAFRYCHHDVGHAIGAISLAASSLGWQSKLIETLSREELSILFGLRDSRGPEAEHPDCLLAITPQAADVNQTEIAKDIIDQLQLLDWQGKANQLSQSHVSWPNLEKIAAVTTKANNEPILFDNPLRNEEKATEEPKKKVYRDKALQIEVNVERGMQFRGDSGDFLELAGNLLDNACKWCKQKVVVSIVPSISAPAVASGMVLTVSDDGPGIPEESATALLERGMRLDESTPGHGIGLAVVNDIAQSYGGTLTIQRSKIGGAQITVSIPPISSAKKDQA